MFRSTALGLAACLCLVSAPSAADDIETALEAALEAYRAGDIARAREEVDFAATLIGQLKAEGLQSFLPAPFDGWTREAGDTSSQALAGFGGGAVATAEYRSGGESVEITLMADNQLVASMAVMLSNTALMSSMGQVKRRGRQTYVVTHEGDVQALVDGRVMVQVTGSAARASKEAYFDLIDIEGLGEF